MHTFRDGLDREWSVSLTVASAGLCRTVLKSEARPAGVDLFRICDDGFEQLGELLADVETLAGVVWVLSDARARGVSFDDFAGGLDGDSIDRLCACFESELVDFFRGAQRAGLKKVLEKAHELETAIQDRVTGILESTSAETILAGLGPKLGGATDPASPGSVEPNG